MLKDIIVTILFVQTHVWFDDVIGKKEQVMSFIDKNVADSRHDTLFAEHVT